MMISLDTVFRSLLPRPDSTAVPPGRLAVLCRGIGIGRLVSPERPREESRVCLSSGARLRRAGAMVWRQLFSDYPVPGGRFFFRHVVEFDTDRE